MKNLEKLVEKRAQVLARKLILNYLKGSRRGKRGPYKPRKN